MLRHTVGCRERIDGDGLLAAADLDRPGLPVGDVDAGRSRGLHRDQQLACGRGARETGCRVHHIAEGGEVGDRAGRAGGADERHPGVHRGPDRDGSLGSRARLLNGVQELPSGTDGGPRMVRPADTLEEEPDGFVTDERVDDAVVPEDGLRREAASRSSLVIVVLDVIVDELRGEGTGARAAAPDGSRACSRSTYPGCVPDGRLRDRSRSTYLPPHTSQLATRLSADGVDDCLVCSTLALVNGASLGEATRTPQGHEPSTAGLVRTAVRMRNKLDDPDTATREQQKGSLPASAAGRMVALMWPAYPTLRTDDIDFKTLVALLLDRHIAVLAGNPSHIQGPSPLKRVGDVGHAIALLRARERRTGLEILVDDPFRPGGKHLRGEWIAAKQVRQFAFRDSDSTLTAVWVERYGAWTAERLIAHQKDRRIDRIEEAAAGIKEAERTEQRLRARIAQLEAGNPVDCGPVVADSGGSVWLRR